MSQQLPAPRSVTELNVSRERSRTEVNEFLEKDVVDHQLGSVPGWKAAFGARYDGQLVAVCVLGRPVARHIDAETVISISRFAALPTRPDNTGSWLIARAREWARLEGYQKLIAYAGVAGNYGTIYEASGFELCKKDKAQGDGWDSREGRQTVSDFIRRKWMYNLH
jgi:GNAT superfamily N-acetyltransferase